MNWAIVVFVAITVVSLALIGATLTSLIKLEDERKNMIKMIA